MKKSELKEIIKEEIYTILKEDHHIQILTNDFGGYDDVEFLTKLWNLSTEEINLIYTKAKLDLLWLNKNSKRGLLSGFNRKDSQYVRNRIKYK